MISPNQALTVKEAVNITPTNPTSSLNGSVTLTSQLAAAYQWRFNGVDLPGETNKTLTLTSVQASQAGPYCVQELTNVTLKQFLTIWEPPALRGAVLADGSCQLTITAEPNRPWRIQASTDLQTWQTIKTVTNTQAKFPYTDTAAGAMNWRFYRVVTE